MVYRRLAFSAIFSAFIVLGAAYFYHATTSPETLSPDTDLKPEPLPDKPDNLTSQKAGDYAAAYYGTLNRNREVEGEDSYEHYSFVVELET